MPLKSDLTLDPSKFAKSAVSARTNALNEKLEQLTSGGPKWYEVGAPKFREMRLRGETQFPKPRYVDHAKTLSLPSRDKGREIPCRVFLPRGHSSKPKSVFYHIHGGGWVLSDEASQDERLTEVADACNLVVLSVGYRLAPEHPYPAANEDCVDVANHLIDNAGSLWPDEAPGVQLRFIGGDSAGGHLSVTTLLTLRKLRPEFHFAGAILHFGAYELGGWTPQGKLFTRSLILDQEIMHHFIDAYLPEHKTEDSRRDPNISPLYADLDKYVEEGGLPAALFTCGTADVLLDDSIFMATRWLRAGAEAVLKIYPGAPHGFIAFPNQLTETSENGIKDMLEFINDHM